MGTHTPGPWRVDEVSTFGAYGVWTDYATHPGHDGEGYPTQICSMFSQCFKQTDNETRPIRDANARLIAAAPDLLATLKQIQETCESDIRQGIVPDNCIVWQIEADARAAIAKAEPPAADTRS